METSQLLFELSSPVRYSILKTIAGEPLRLTKLSEAVGGTNPEVSRHLERLKKAVLVQKDPAGTYSLTHRGRVLLTMLRGFSFVAHNETFFQERNLSHLPESFIYRLGELDTGEFEDGVFASIKRGIRITHEAEKWIHIIASEASTEFDSIIAEQMEKGVEFRMIIDPNFRFNPGTFPPEPLAKQMIRVVEQNPVMLMASEKETGLCFLNYQDQFHFLATCFSRDPSFLGWVDDLFEYLWKRGEHLSEHPEITER